MKLGKAKYGSGKKSFKVERDKSNVFRILPPMGKLADAGVWYKYYRVEWGYKDTEGKHKPFLDCRVVNFKNKMVEVESEAYLRRNALYEAWEALKEKEKNNTITPEETTNLGKLVELRKRYNLDAKYYMNVTNLKGEIGVLKLNSRHMNALRDKLKKLQDAGSDPLSIDKGLYFDFTKSNSTGSLQDWTFTVDVYTENVEAMIDGVKTTVARPKFHAMDEAFIARLDSEAWDLSDMYTAPTAEQVARIVKEGPVAVDEILGKSNDNAQSAPVEEQAPDMTPNAVPTTTAPTTTPTPTPAPVVEELAAPIVATEQPTPAPETPVTETSVTEESAPSSEADDQDFLKKIGAI